MRQDSDTAAIPLVLLSASGRANEIEAGLASDARDHLVKPVVPQQLAARIAEILADARQPG